tara:strand:- start:3001 stop:3753 length:753 start_codon:yes stop_codon:yes gene_type:complete
MKLTKVPTATTVRRTSHITNAKKTSNLVGAIEPFKDGLDPFGFSKNTDVCTLRRYREAEITHGRVAMLASVGFLTGECVEGKGPFFESQVTGPAINHFQQVPLPFWLWLGSAIALAEAFRVQKGWESPFTSKKLWTLCEDYNPGDLGFNPLGLADKPDDLKNAQEKELSNGRLAMLAITGMVVQELVVGLNVIPADDAFVMKGIPGVVEMQALCENSVNEAVCANNFDKTLEIAEKAKVAAFLTSENISP